MCKNAVIAVQYVFYFSVIQYKIHICRKIAVLQLEFVGEAVISIEFCIRLIFSN